MDTYYAIRVADEPADRPAIMQHLLQCVEYEAGEPSGDAPADDATRKHIEE